MKIAMGLLLTVSAVAAQTAPDTADVHVAAAKAAAGEDYSNLFNFMCAAPAQRGGPGGRGAGGGARATAGQAPRGVGAPAPARGVGRGAPDRSTWHAEPVKVFDNLYFLGQSEYSVWALTSSEGIILLDAIFDYSVEEEVEGGMRKLGLDPTTIKYAILSHAHPDHFGGGKFLQDKFGARAVMSAADWDAVERMNGTKPKRDMTATDGQTITVGDVSVTLYITPGHTPGTISSIFQVKDGGKTRTVALWGGTGLNADRESLTRYVASAKRFQELAKQAGAEIVLSNHTDWDRSKINLPLLAKRASSPVSPADANPYVADNASVLRYLKVAEECATARLLRLN